MNRRRFLAVAATVPLAGYPASVRSGVSASEMPAPLPTGAVWRRFEITTCVTLPGVAGPAQLWLPLAQTAGGYQTALHLRWDGTGHTERVYDYCYGAPILTTTWPEQDRSPRQVEVIQTVATCERAATPLLPLTEAERRFWTTPTASASSDSIVHETAARITGGKTTPRDRLRALYDWVVDSTHRDPATPGCGSGDVITMLRSGRLGGKCADINSLLVALARAAGFPARDVYGIRVAESCLFPSLGHSGDVSKTQHCRAEVFLDDEGWLPVDAADVRKVVLEQKLALDSPEIVALRERLFGHWEPNWVGYNSGTDIRLPGHGSPMPGIAFLMYPHGVTSEGPAPALDPERFRYKITAREVTI